MANLESLASIYRGAWEEIDTVEEINKTYKKGYNEGYVEGYDEGYPYLQLMKYLTKSQLYLVQTL